MLIRFNQRINLEENDYNMLITALKYTYSLIFIFVLSIAVTVAAEFQIQTYTENDWLPSSIALSVLQDRDGSVWVATRRGIASYSGNAWSNSIYAANANQFRRILQIAMDSKGSIWGIRMGDSLEVVNLKNPRKSIPATEMFKAYSSFEEKVYFSVNTDKNGLVAAVGVEKRGVRLFRNGKWENYLVGKYPIMHDMLGVYTDGNNVLVPTRIGLYVIDSHGFGKYFKHNDPFENVPVLAVARGKRDKSKLWVLTNNKIQYIENHKIYTLYDKLDIQYLINPGNFTLIPEYYNSIAFAGNYGVHIYNPKNKRLETITRQNGLLDDVCSSMIKDRENNLWITSFRGVTKISGIKFKNFFDKDGLLDDEVTSIVQRSDGDFIIGHRNGISFYDGEKITGTKKFDLRLTERVNNMVCTRDGTIYMACFRNGIGILDKKNNLRWISPEQMHSGPVMSVTNGENNQLLFSTTSGIGVLRNGSARKLKCSKNIKFLRGVASDKKGKIYAFTSRNGIFEIENDKIIRHIKAKSNQVPPNNIFCVYFDDEGKIYAGTEDGLYIEENGLLQKQTFGSALFEQFIFFITKDKDDNFWFGTENGVIRKHNENIQTYKVKDGLVGQETNRGAGVVASNGRLLFGTNTGMSVYYSEFDGIGKVKPLLGRLSLEAGSETYRFSDVIRIRNDVNNFSVYFAVMSFFDEKHNTIKYKLAGVDESWQELDAWNNREIKYKGLRPGTYRLYIVPKNVFGDEGRMFVSGKIIINSPYYKSPIFYIVVLASMAIIAVIIFRQRAVSIYNKKLRQEVAERTAQLEQSENRYRQMFENNNAMMLLIDFDTLNTLDANPAIAKYFGVSREWFIGKNVIELVPSGSMEDIKKLKSGIITESEIGLNFYSNLKKAYCYLLVHVSLIKDKNKDILYCIIDDVTERNVAENALKDLNRLLESRIDDKTKELSTSLNLLRKENTLRADTEIKLKAAKNEVEKALEKEKQNNRFKTQFINMISHEYRTPLSVVSSSNELISLMLEHKRYDKIAACNKKIKFAGNNLTNLFESALVIGNNEDIKPYLQKFDVNELLHNVTDNIENNETNKHIIRYELTGGKEFFINSDRQLVKGFASQVILNAFKYSPTGTEIIIKTAVENGKFILTVKDFGQGIPPEDLDHIYEPFFKGVKNIGLVSGIGMGLPVSKKYVDALGGSINIDSRENEFTEVVISIDL